ncbi:hypothetical protein HXX76_000145 [Chlamydomonas incerta]|uniref:Uncharacterized protein n=1 Tax=Chlamydomonas incerta TaxID=51695 RepID=A0A835WE73_CHLIN|nr:hypothetical protein HXX76_000145 [Chlamydomonas incerta]|eukprot:KAG2445530.1 hypothetical protein HXX76_000145 [Chlamydomonas incerta]
MQVQHPNSAGSRVLQSRQGCSEAKTSVCRSFGHAEEATCALVSGSLPAWLRGSLFFNGCGEYTGMEHLFDGYSVLVKLRFNDGQAFGRQRYLDSDAYRHFKATGRMRYREFATAPKAQGLGGALLGLYDTLSAAVQLGRIFTDNASVSFTPLPGGRMLALSEAVTSAYVVDGTSLETRQHLAYKDGVKGDLQSAHPKVAPDGSIINFSHSFPFGGLHVSAMDPVTLQRREIAFIKDRDNTACWSHDIALTARHAVIVEHPTVMSMEALALGREAQYAFMDWRPEVGTRVHVVALDGSGVVTHTAPPFFTFHFSNAFERPAAAGSGSEICVDLSVYDDPQILNDLRVDHLTAFPGGEIAPSRLARLTIPLTDAFGAPAGPAALAAPAPLLKDDAAYGNYLEFCAFNPEYRFKPYRYTYGTAAVRPTNMANALAQHDMQAGTSRVWHEPGSMLSEPTFVPRPGATEEDDGVVLSLLTRGDGGGSQLLVLDGRTFTEAARLQLPFAVPFRFHGAFVAGQQ